VKGDLFLDRNILIQQVKNEYARLAGLASRGHITDRAYSMQPEAYYEQVLEKAISDISAGKYDDCVSGLQIVERIANHKTKVRRVQETIEATLHNMETAQDTIASDPDGKEKQQLIAENERRAEAIPQMIRTMKQEQAQEELEAGSPNVIGGGGNG
jgi:small acid-soluble spore protein tlp